MKNVIGKIMMLILAGGSFLAQADNQEKVIYDGYCRVLSGDQLKPFSPDEHVQFFSGHDSDPDKIILSLDGLNYTVKAIEPLDESGKPDPTKPIMLIASIVKQDQTGYRSVIAQAATRTTPDEPGRLSVFSSLAKPQGVVTGLQLACTPKPIEF